MPAASASVPKPAGALAHADDAPDDACAPADPCLGTSCDPFAASGGALPIQKVGLETDEIEEIPDKPPLPPSNDACNICSCAGI